jgi:hypothetical protein
MNTRKSTQKLSEGLQRFIRTARATDTVGYILMLKLDDVNELATMPSRQGHLHREMPPNNNQVKEKLLCKVDTVLKKFGGRRLSPTVSLFGTIFVESSLEALQEFASADYVNAISENSHVSRLG